MMRSPPGLPSTATGLPSLSRKVGDMLDSDFLPGATQLAEDGSSEKSSIVSLRQKPSPSGATLEPKKWLIVLVQATRFPARSATEK